MKPESRRQLELFVELGEKLRESSYTKHMEAVGGASVNFTFSTGLDGSEPGASLSHNYPAEEPIIAMAVRARQFIQSNDYVSLRKMKPLLEDPGISPEWKERFSDVREHLTKYLEAPSMMAEQGPGGTNQRRYTNREVFDIFVSGSIAHSDPKYAAILKNWQHMGLAYIMLQHAFHQSVHMIIKGIAYLGGYTILELKGEPVPPIEQDEAA